MNAFLILTLAAGAGLAAPVPANAQDAQPAGVKPVRSQLDPGEILCQRVKEVGSRLIVKEVCMTRLQWQEQKTADRIFTEGIQSQLGALRDGG